MKILLDLQAVQGENLYRGIGRYALSLASTLKRRAGSEHQIIAGLNLAIPRQYTLVRQKLAEVFPESDIVTWTTPPHDRRFYGDADVRAAVGEVIQDAAISALAPDIVHQAGLIEGYHDNAISRVRPQFAPYLRFATFYDAIPLKEPDTYLADPYFAKFYRNRLSLYSEMDHTLAISPTAKREAMTYAGLAEVNVTNISTAASAPFTDGPVADAIAARALSQFGLAGNFVLYAGGFDSRKNIPVLINAFLTARKTQGLDAQLVLAGKIPPDVEGELIKHAASVGLRNPDIRFLGYVTDEQLAALYSICSLFVMPTRHEGFGLPALEAMLCGAPVIASDADGVREIVKAPEAMFDPSDTQALANLIARAVKDEDFRTHLRQNGAEQTRRFSWDITADTALQAMESVAAKKSSVKARRGQVLVLTGDPTAGSAAAQRLSTLIRRLDSQFDVKIVSPSHASLAKALGVSLTRQQMMSVEDFDKLRDARPCVIASLSADAPCRWIVQRLKDQPAIVVTHEADPKALQEALGLSHNGAKEIMLKTLGWRRIADAHGELAGLSAYDRLSGLLAWLGEMSPAIFATDLDPEVLPASILTTDDRFTAYGKDQDESFADAVEAVARGFHSGTSNRQILTAIVDRHSDTIPDELATDIAISLASNTPRRKPRPQLLVDVSHLAVHDAQSGIQRVVRSLLREMLTHVDTSFDIQPVLARGDQGYTYARKFTARFLGLDIVVEDEPVDVFEGDIFLGLDLTSDIASAHESWLQHIRRIGAKVVFVVYDLLPNLSPQYFPSGVVGAAKRWVPIVARTADQALCISRTVADELTEWVARADLEDRLTPLDIDYWPLGANIDLPDASPQDVDPAHADALEQMIERPSALMVGTIEPRKGYDAVLDAFEVLWQQGVDANLVIVGKVGWQTERTVARIRKLSAANSRMIWFENASDALLLAAYEHATGVIAASFGEGFGLPIVEARRHGKAVLARDIPVFREVGDVSASYFKTGSPEDLARDIKAWLGETADQERTMPDEADIVTWEESAAALIAKLS